AVHAAAKAVVDAELDRLDHATARPVLRVAREHPDPGAILAPAFIQVTARTSQLVADVFGHAVARGREQGRSPPHGVSIRPGGSQRIRRTTRGCDRKSRIGPGASDY